MSVAFKHKSTFEFVSDDDRPILIVPIGNKYSKSPKILFKLTLKIRNFIYLFVSYLVRDLSKVRVVPQCLM